MCQDRWAVLYCVPQENPVRKDAADREATVNRPKVWCKKAKNS